jgi:SAM-dependent methyltransferase
MKTPILPFIVTQLRTACIRLHRAALLAVLPLLFALPAAAADSPAPPPANTATNKPDVVFVPTPQVVVDKMLEMAVIKPGDVVYDLGCGDGRIVVTAAKRYGVKGVGFDIDPQRIRESLANVRSNKVEHLVSIQQKDIFKLDLSEATVVCLYLLPSLNVRLTPQLEKLRPGSRILSHDFDMEGAKPLQVFKIPPENGSLNEDDLDSHEHTIYKWVVPWEKTRTAPSLPDKRP